MTENANERRRALEVLMQYERSPAVVTGERTGDEGRVEDDVIPKQSGTGTVRGNDDVEKISNTKRVERKREQVLQNDRLRQQTTRQNVRTCIKRREGGGENDVEARNGAESTGRKRSLEMSESIKTMLKERRRYMEDDRQYSDEDEEPDDLEALSREELEAGKKKRRTSKRRRIKERPTDGEEGEENRNDDEGERTGSSEESREEVVKNVRKGSKKRGRPKGSQNKEKTKRSGTHFKQDDVLNLCRAWIEQSHKKIQSGVDLWSGIRTICKEKYGMDRTEESLRSKWKSVAHDVQIWITVDEQNKRRKTTGNLNEGERERMNQKFFMLRTTKNGRSGKPFKYISAAKFLSSYPKFMCLHEEENVVTGVEITGNDGESGLEENDDNGSSRRRWETNTSGNVEEEADNMNSTSVGGSENAMEEGTGTQPMNEEVRRTEGNSEVEVTVRNNDVGRRNSDIRIETTHNNGNDGNDNGTGPTDVGTERDASAGTPSSRTYTNNNERNVGTPVGSNSNTVRGGGREENDEERTASGRRLRRNGVKLMKREELEMIRHYDNNNVMNGIKNEIGRTNQLIEELVETEKALGRNETLYMALQFMPNQSAGYSEISNALVLAAREASEQTKRSSRMVTSGMQSSGRVDETGGSNNEVGSFPDERNEGRIQEQVEERRQDGIEERREREVEERLQHGNDERREGLVEERRQDFIEERRDEEMPEVVEDRVQKRRKEGNQEGLERRREDGDEERFIKRREGRIEQRPDRSKDAGIERRRDDERRGGTLGERGYGDDILLE